MMPRFMQLMSRLQTRRAYRGSLSRRLIVATVVLATAAGLSAAWAQNGVDPRVAPGGITLKQALEKGLKARRPSEFAFIRLVVDLVEDGVLPRKMVERTFLYARDRRQPYPMPYFEKALQLQAKKIGVKLPFTDT